MGQDHSCLSEDVDTYNGTRTHVRSQAQTQTQHIYRDTYHGPEAPYPETEARAQVRRLRHQWRDLDAEITHVTRGTKQIAIGKNTKSSTSPLTSLPSSSPSSLSNTYADAHPTEKYARYIPAKARVHALVHECLPTLVCSSKKHTQISNKGGCQRIAHCAHVWCHGVATLLLANYMRINEPTGASDTQRTEAETKTREIIEVVLNIVIKAIQTGTSWEDTFVEFRKKLQGLGWLREFVRAPAAFASLVTQSYKKSVTVRKIQTERWNQSASIVQRLSNAHQVENRWFLDRGEHFETSEFSIWNDIHAIVHLNEEGFGELHEYLESIDREHILRPLPPIGAPLEDAFQLLEGELGDDFIVEWNIISPQRFTALIDKMNMQLRQKLRHSNWLAREQEPKTKQEGKREEGGVTGIEVEGAAKTQVVWFPVANAFPDYKTLERWSWKSLVAMQRLQIAIPLDEDTEVHPDNNNPVAQVAFADYMEKAIEFLQTLLEIERSRWRVEDTKLWNIRTASFTAKVTTYMKDKIAAIESELNLMTKFRIKLYEEKLKGIVGAYERKVKNTRKNWLMRQRFQMAKWLLTQIAMRDLVFGQHLAYAFMLARGKVRFSVTSSEDSFSKRNAAIKDFINQMARSREFLYDSAGTRLLTTPDQYVRASLADSRFSAPYEIAYVFGCIRVDDWQRMRKFAVRRAKFGIDKRILMWNPREGGRVTRVEMHVSPPSFGHMNLWIPEEAEAEGRLEPIRPREQILDLIITRFATKFEEPLMNRKENADYQRIPQFRIGWIIDGRESVSRVRVFPNRSMNQTSFGNSIGLFFHDMPHLESLHIKVPQSYRSVPQISSAFLGITEGHIHSRLYTMLQRMLGWIESPDVAARFIVILQKYATDELIRNVDDTKEIFRDLATILGLMREVRGIFSEHIHALIEEETQDHERALARGGGMPELRSLTLKNSKRENGGQAALRTYIATFRGVPQLEGLPVNTREGNRKFYIHRDVGGLDFTLNLDLHPNIEKDGMNAVTWGSGCQFLEHLHIEGLNLMINDDFFVGMGHSPTLELRLNILANVTRGGSGLPKIYKQLLAELVRVGEGRINGAFLAELNKILESSDDEVLRYVDHTMAIDDERNAIEVHFPPALETITFADVFVADSFFTSLARIPVEFEIKIFVDSVRGKEAQRKRLREAQRVAEGGEPRASKRARVTITPTRREKTITKQTSRFRALRRLVLVGINDEDLRDYLDETKFGTLALGRIHADRREDNAVYPTDATLYAIAGIMKGIEHEPRTKQEGKREEEGATGMEVEGAAEKEEEEEVVQEGALVNLTHLWLQEQPFFTNAGLRAVADKTRRHLQNLGLVRIGHTPSARPRSITRVRDGRTARVGDAVAAFFFAGNPLAPLEENGWKNQLRSVRCEVLRLTFDEDAMESEIDDMKKWTDEWLPLTIAQPGLMQWYWAELRAREQRRTDITLGTEEVRRRPKDVTKRKRDKEGEEEEEEGGITGMEVEGAAAEPQEEEGEEEEGPERKRRRTTQQEEEEEEGEEEEDPTRRERKRKRESEEEEEKEKEGGGGAEQMEVEETGKREEDADIAPITAIVKAFDTLSEQQRNTIEVQWNKERFKERVWIRMRDTTDTPMLNMGPKADEFDHTHAWWEKLHASEIERLRQTFVSYETRTNVALTRLLSFGIIENIEQLYLRGNLYIQPRVLVPVVHMFTHLLAFPSPNESFDSSELVEGEGEGERERKRKQKEEEDVPIEVHPKFSVDELGKPFRNLQTLVIDGGMMHEIEFSFFDFWAIFMQLRDSAVIKKLHIKGIRVQKDVLHAISTSQFKNSVFGATGFAYDPDEVQFSEFHVYNQRINQSISTDAEIVERFNAFVQNFNV